MLTCIRADEGISLGLSHAAGKCYSKFLVSPLMLENQMEKKIENEMETGII